jgi:hypothetical protein
MSSGRTAGQGAQKNARYREPAYENHSRPAPELRFWRDAQPSLRLTDPTMHGGDEVHQGPKRPQYSDKRLGMEGLSVYDDDGSDTHEEEPPAKSASTDVHVSVLLCPAPPSPFPSFLALFSVSE